MTSLAKRIRTCSIAASAGLVVAFAGTVPANGATADDDSPQQRAGVSETYVDRAGVVHYEFDPASLPGFTVKSEQGRSDSNLRSGSDSTCMYSAQSTHDDDRVVVGIELSFDPATCTLEIAEASYRQEEVPQAVEELIAAKSSGSSDQQAASGLGTGGIAPLAAASWRGYISVFHNDPIPAQVNSTRAVMGWNSGARTDANGKWNWLSGTGWSRTSHSVTASGLTTTARGSFKNVLFCNPVAATYTSHKAVFKGYANGGWATQRNWSKSGDCSSLLQGGYAAERWTL